VVKAELPFSIRTFGKKLNDKTFSNDLNDGFLIDRVRDTYIEARYIEKVAVANTVQDPLGNEYSYERIDYRQTEFRLANSYPQLELTNPPRGIQAFTSRLSELGDFSLSVSPLEVNVLRWAEHLSELFPERFLVDAIQASGLVVDENVTARVILSGTSDVRRPLLRFTNGRKFGGLDRLQVRFGVGRETAKILLFADGAAKLISDDPTEDIASTLRKALVLSLK